MRGLPGVKAMALPCSPSQGSTDRLALWEGRRKVQLSKYNSPLNNGPQTFMLFHVFFLIQINLPPWHSKGGFISLLFCVLSSGWTRRTT